MRKLNLFAKCKRTEAGAEATQRKRQRLKVTIIFLITGIFYIACLFFTEFLKDREAFSEIPTLQSRNSYRILADEYCPRKEIKQYIVADGQIFLNYESAGLVNVYSTDGKFLYGIQISVSQNGIGSIAVSEGKLYMESRYTDLYIFMGTELVEKIFHNANVDEATQKRYRQFMTVFDQEPNRIWENREYKLSRDQSKISATDANGTCEVVLELPKKNPIADILTPVSLLGISLACFWIGKIENKEEKKSEA